MKKIIFNNVEYNLVYYTIENSTKLRATIYKEDYDIPTVAEEVKESTSITIKEDDEVIAQYSQFNTLVALQIFNNYPVLGEITDSVISIEFENTDLQAQIEALQNSVTAVQSNVDTVSEEVSTKADSSVVSENTEVIGQPSTQSYSVGDTFVADGLYYVVTADILVGSTLVVNGNCELTTLTTESEE